jgi:hypothetical protein
MSDDAWEAIREIKAAMDADVVEFKAGRLNLKEMKARLKAWKQAVKQAEERMKTLRLAASVGRLR